MTHHPSAASLRLHGARLLFPPVATLLFLVLTEYIARGALSGDTFVQYIFPHAEAVCPPRWTFTSCSSGASPSSRGT